MDILYDIIPKDVLKYIICPYVLKCKYKNCISNIPIPSKTTMYITKKIGKVFYMIGAKQGILGQNIILQYCNDDTLPKKTINCLTFSDRIMYFDKYYIITMSYSEKKTIYVCKFDREFIGTIKVYGTIRGIVQKNNVLYIKTINTLTTYQLGKRIKEINTVDLPNKCGLHNGIIRHTLGCVYIVSSSDNKLYISLVNEKLDGIKMRQFPLPEDNSDNIEHIIRYCEFRGVHYLIIFRSNCVELILNNKIISKINHQICDNANIDGRYIRITSLNNPTNIYNYRLPPI